MKVILNKTTRDDYNLTIGPPAGSGAEMMVWPDGSAARMQFIVYGLPLDEVKDLIVQLTGAVAAVEQAAAETKAPA